METVTPNSGSVRYPGGRTPESHRHHHHSTAPVQKTQLVPVSDRGMTLISRKCE